MRELDSPAGHIICTLLVFVIGAGLYLRGFDYGKEIIAGSLGSLWTIIQLRNNTKEVKA